MHSNLENQKIFLAPMEDVTDYPFRQVLLRIGRPEVFFTEFVNVDGLVSEGYKNVVHRLEFNKRESPIVIQFWGRDSNKFKEALNFIEDVGFSGININIGCPVKKVLKAGCGAALINEFDIVRDIVNSLDKANIPVSIKTRLGINSFDKDWFSFLLDLNLHSLFIHGRSREQKFLGMADWDSISKVVRMRDVIGVQTKIIGNGDVCNMDQASRLKKGYGVDGVMVGREVLKNPWVFSGREVLSIDERISTLLYHLKQMQSFTTKFEGKSWHSIKKFYYGYLREDNYLVKLRKDLFKKNLIEETIRLLEQEVS